MSEDKIKRRRFLADILFAGGAISAAALLAKATQMGASPAPVTPPAPPAPQPPPVPLDGDAEIPQVRATRQPEPVLGGKPMAPQPQVKGDVAVPRQQLKP